MKNESWKSVIAIVASISLLASGVIMSFNGIATAAIIATYTFGSFCFLLGFLDKVAAFSVFGLQARLKEAIIEADEVLDRLKGVLRPLSEMVFTLAARIDHWDTSLSRTEQLRLMSNFRRQLLQTGIEEDELDNLAKDWIDSVARDLAQPVIERITHSINLLHQEVVKQMQDYPHPIHSDDPKWLELQAQSDAMANIAMQAHGLAAEPSAIRTFVRNCAVLNESEQERLLADGDARLNELAYFLRNKTVRHPEQWLASHPLSLGFRD